MLFRSHRRPHFAPTTTPISVSVYRQGLNMSEHPQVFTRFPQLPTELRRMIVSCLNTGALLNDHESSALIFTQWTEAVERRIVEVHPISGGFNYHAHPPPLLNTNRESRGIALRIYTLRHVHLQSKAAQDQSKITCYNPDWDLLYFPYKSQVFETFP